jgi:predicted CXXCH cytochrome family protein
LHGQAAARGDELAPSCADCHGTHDILSHLDQRSPTRVMNIPFLCGECHHEGTPVSRQRDIPQDRILENYSLSIHGEGLYQQGLTVTAVCTSCHTSHEILPHTDPASSIHRDNVAGTCQQCHAQIEEVHQQVIEGELWEAEPGAVPACVDCHAPHQIRRVYYEAGAANEDCLSCHRQIDIQGSSQGVQMSLFVDEQAYYSGAHAGTACAQCHTEVSSTLARPCAAIQNPVECGACHEDQVEQFSTSTHGTLAAAGDPDAPVCLTCHERHATQTQRMPTSPTFPRNVPELCSGCHAQGQQAAVRIHGDVPTPVESYEMSIHGTGLFQSGLLVTATCSSCHTAHHVLPTADPASSVHNDNVSTTCGTCHHGIEEEFRSSIHWPEIAGELEPGRELPTCENCHTSHTISRTDRDDYRLEMMDQCGYCHEHESETFFETIHGKVAQLGEAGAAKCYDCHGTHNILPTSNPDSMLGRRNVVETCAQCHSGANIRFTGYLTHATHHDQEHYPYLFWTFWGMTTLLVGTMSFFTVHTSAWLWRLSRSKEMRVRYHATAGKKLYRRFDSFQRSLHMSMLLSFFTLALTGMILKFSYMGWAQWLTAIMGGYATTGVLHRIAAIVLITVFLIHLRDVLRQKRESGKSWLQFITAENSMLFNKRDLVEFWGSMKWFVGVGKRPEYGRYTYWEKFDYFAVFWGMFVIGSTGLMLWFPTFFTLFLPGWTVNIATILHSDEALLAVAFIFTIHFFNTHFRPDKFPMDPVIFTGRVTLEELKRDKPREYAELLKSGKLDEENLAEPFPEGAERFFRYFGFIALGVGLTLIVLIIYSMLYSMFYASG